jgi:DNA-binding response OmpR family regulator
MSNPHPNIIPFASGRLMVDTGHQLIIRREGGFRRIAPKRFAVLQLLADNVGEVVSLEELIDTTQPNLITGPDRFRQQQRVVQYIGGLRRSLDQLIPQAGDPERGVLQNEFSVGYWLAEYWRPSELSTEPNEFLT